MFGKSIIYRFLLVLGVTFFASSCSSETLDLRVVTIGEEKFDLEIADTAELRAEGLMWRTELAEDRGMLFVYPSAGYYRIWMKNTLIPLKVLWIGDDFRIQGIKTLLPCDSSPCLSYGIEEKSRYIIELNANVDGINQGMAVSGIE